MTADPGERTADVADAAQDEHAPACLGTATEPGASAGADDAAETQAAESRSPCPGGACSPDAPEYPGAVR